MWDDKAVGTISKLQNITFNIYNYYYPLGNNSGVIIIE